MAYGEVLVGKVADVKIVSGYGTGFQFTIHVTALFSLIDRHVFPRRFGEKYCHV
jgi:hypothetical protein